MLIEKKFPYPAHPLYMDVMTQDFSIQDTTFKIFQLSEWEALQSVGTFAGSAVDLSDGFVHLSDAHQLQGTLDKHYTKGADIVVAEVTVSTLGPALTYEVSRGGDKFPHLYAPLLKDAVSCHWHLSPNASGRYDISEITS